MPQGGRPGPITLARLCKTCRMGRESLGGLALGMWGGEGGSVVGECCQQHCQGGCQARQRQRVSVAIVESLILDLLRLLGWRILLVTFVRIGLDGIRPLLPDGVVAIIIRRSSVPLSGAVSGEGTKWSLSGRSGALYGGLRGARTNLHGGIATHKLRPHIFGGTCNRGVYVALITEGLLGFIRVATNFENHLHMMTGASASYTTLQIILTAGGDKVVVDSWLEL